MSGHRIRKRGRELVMRTPRGGGKIVKRRVGEFLEGQRWKEEMEREAGAKRHKRRWGTVERSDASTNS